MNSRSTRPGRGTLALPLAAMLLLIACNASPPPAATDEATTPAADSADAATSMATPEPVESSPAPEPELSPVMRLMKQLDSDGDGRMSRAEHAFKAGQTFDKMDADHDGIVTVEEMDAVRKGLYGDNRSATTAAIAVGDSNRDGVLSSDEHATATRVEFERMDTDHDAYLTVAELEWANANSGSGNATTR